MHLESLDSAREITWAACRANFIPAAKKLPGLHPAGTAPQEPYRLTENNSQGPVPGAVPGAGRETYCPVLEGEQRALLPRQPIRRHAAERVRRPPPPVCHQVADAGSSKDFMQMLSGLKAAQANSRPTLFSMGTAYGAAETGQLLSPRRALLTISRLCPTLSPTRSAVG